MDPNRSAASDRERSPPPRVQAAGPAASRRPSPHANPAPLVRLAPEASTSLPAQEPANVEATDQPASQQHSPEAQGSLEDTAEP